MLNAVLCDTREWLLSDWGSYFLFTGVWNSISITYDVIFITPD